MKEDPSAWPLNTIFSIIEMTMMFFVVVTIGALILDATIVVLYFLGKM